MGGTYASKNRGALIIPSKDARRDFLATLYNGAVNDAEFHSNPKVRREARTWLIDSVLCKMCCDFLGIDHQASIESMSDRWDFTPPANLTNRNIALTNGDETYIGGDCSRCKDVGIMFNIKKTNNRNCLNWRKHKRINKCVYLKFKGSIMKVNKKDTRHRSEGSFLGKSIYKLIGDKTHSVNCVILHLMRLANGCPEKDLLCSVIHLAILDAFKDKDFKVGGVTVRAKARLWLSEHYRCEEYCELVGLDYEWMMDSIPKD